MKNDTLIREVDLLYDYKFTGLQEDNTYKWLQLHLQIVARDQKATPPSQARKVGTFTDFATKL